MKRRNLSKYLFLISHSGCQDCSPWTSAALFQQLLNFENYQTKYDKKTNNLQWDPTYQLVWNYVFCLFVGVFIVFSNGVDNKD